MNIALVLIPLALILGLLFVGFFIWSAIDGQYDDLSTPPHKILIDQESVLYEERRKYDGQ